MASLPKGVSHDGAMLPWLGDVLADSYLINRSRGCPVQYYDTLWSKDHNWLPGWWPLNGRMSA